MSLIPTVYKSTDPGAPALTGQTGSLRDLLRAVLVNGYGTGANLKAGAGWTEPHSGTNVSVFRNSPVTGTGAYLRVDDSATYSGSNARSALVRAFESMADLDTGTGPTPTVAQVASGLMVPKSYTANSTARAWRAYANERALWLVVDPGATDSAWVGLPHFPVFFGDIITRKPGDNFHFALLAPPPNFGFGSGAWFQNHFQGAISSAVSSPNGYVMRPYTHAASAAAVDVLQLSDNGTQAIIGAAGSYPDPVSGGFRAERITLYEAAQVIRGYLPGVWALPHGLAFADQQVVPASSIMPLGTTLVAQRVTNVLGGFAAPWSGVFLFDTSNGWS